MRQTLLLRLAGPMQSWGTQSRFSIRDTGLEPSKSGVFGLLCAAMGVRREDHETLSQLREHLVMGVRVDHEGIVKKDFHTANNVAKANGGGLKETEISDRWYLADADFLVGLESEDRELLDRLNHAVAYPVWQIFLGRKSFVPSQPVRVGDTPIEKPLRDAFREIGWQAINQESPPEKLRLVLDATPETSLEVRQDVPLSFQDRRFIIRHVKTEFMEVPLGGQ